MLKTLPLTAFERCMLLDDRDEYPRLCIVRVLFQGQVDRKSLELALLETIKNHWLLRATVSGGWRKSWCIKEPTLPPIQWIQQRTGLAIPPAERIDLRIKTGLRIVVCQDEISAEINFQYHHACCDGLGFICFFEEFLYHYAAFQSSGRRSDQVEIDPQRAVCRGSHNLTIRDLVLILPNQIVGVIGAVQYCLRTPTPIANSNAQDTSDTQRPRFPASAAFRLSREHTVALRKAARGRKVSQNEVLSRDFFLALWEWQKKQTTHNERSWLRMMIPINMRDASYRTLPAVNCVSSVFLDRQAFDGADEEQLLKSIREEMGVIRKFDLQHTFLLSLGLMQWIPGFMRFSVRTRTCTASAVFTNPGKFLRRCKLPRIRGHIQAGNLTLIDVDALAPIRPRTNVALCVHEYRNRLKFNLHYDPRAISHDNAEQIVWSLHQRLIATATA